MISDECLEVVVVEAGQLSPVTKAVFIPRVPDEVHGLVFDDGHVLRPVARPEASALITSPGVWWDGMPPS